jgi:hypothetical protein
MSKPLHTMRSAFFWDITQRRMVIFCRRFGTTYRSHLQGSRSTTLAAERHLAEGQFSKVTENRNKGLKLSVRRIRIPVTSRRDERYFKHKKNLMRQAMFV